MEERWGVCIAGEGGGIREINEVWKGGTDGIEVWMEG